MGITASKGFQSFASKIERDLENRFPNILGRIEGISIGRNKDPSVGTNGGFKLGPSLAKAGVFMNTDSYSPRNYYANPQIPAMRIESPAPVMKYIKDSIASGKTEEQVKKEIQTMMYFDSKAGQYVMVPTVNGLPGATADSLLGGTAIPYWNIGFLNKIFKQPFAPSFAKNLVSVEGFNNPWADAVAVFKESFEGFGRISNVARGNFEMNNSNPVSNEMGQIMTDVINLAVDYESSIEEQMRATGQVGNFLSPVAFGDRERYANMILERMHDALILFGNAETGTEGLLDVATGGVVNYTGTPFNTIVNNPAETTKGSKIVEALNGIIQEFLRENLYMPREIRINVSTYVMKAMTSTTYSQGYNPASPMEIIKGRFDSQNSLGGGVQSCSWTMVADPMLDPNTPFNPNNYDLFVITVPSVSSALEDQHGLVIAPEVLKQFIVPPMYQRGGMLYTMYKRVGGIIAPVENTVRVYSGVGYEV
jgi:hypothetical protein